MSDSATFAPKIFSGTDVVDLAWGGLYRGGRYLVYGTNASGRSLLTTAYLAAGTRLLDTSLLVSRLRQKDLAIQSASLGYDLPEAIRSGILRLSRTPFELELVDRDDDSLESSLKALASLIIDSGAERVVIDDFSRFTRFSSFDRFRTAFVRLLTELEHATATLLIGMPEPANDASRRIVDFVGTLMTGCLHVHLGCVDGFSQRTISLIPQIGHLTRRFDLSWAVDHAVATADEMTGAFGRRLDSLETETAVEQPAELRDAEDAASPLTPIEPPSEVEEETGQTETEGKEPMSFEFSVEAASDVDTTEEAVFTDRRRFAEELQLYYDDFESSATTFTLVAMRSDEPNDGSASDDFRSIIGALQEVMGREDSIFADSVVERIIVILGDGGADSAQQLFTRLRSYLRESRPERAEHLLNVVAAVVVPNGKPFATAEEFISYVLDEA